MTCPSALVVSTTFAAETRPHSERPRRAATNRAWAMCGALTVMPRRLSRSWDALARLPHGDARLRQERTAPTGRVDAALLTQRPPPAPVGSLEQDYPLGWAPSTKVEVARYKGAQVRREGAALT